MSRYESAREIYGSLGVDTEKAIETLRSTAVSVHIEGTFMLLTEWDRLVSYWIFTGGTR